MCLSRATQTFYDEMAERDKTLMFYDGDYHEPHNDAIREQVFADIDLRSRYSVEAALMWDAENLYLAAKWKDPTPMYSTVDPDYLVILAIATEHPLTEPDLIEGHGAYRRFDQGFGVDATTTIAKTKGLEPLAALLFLIRLHHVRGSILQLRKSWLSQSHKVRHL